MCTPEAAGARGGGDAGGGKSSPSLSSRNSRGGTGGFTLSLAFPPRGFLYDIGVGISPRIASSPRFYVSHHDVMKSLDL